MNSIRRLLAVIVMIGSTTTLTTGTLAQTNSRLPDGLNQTSSLADVLTWLDTKGFPEARIGLEVWREGSSLMGLDSRSVFDEAMVSRGFKLLKADGCNLTLRNDDVKLLDFGTTSFPGEQTTLPIFKGRRGDYPTPVPAEVYLKVNRLKFDGKGPRLNKDKAKANLMGAWRTEFKRKWGRPWDPILMVVFDVRPEAGRDAMYTQKITFHFDSKELAEQFDAAFQQAIRLCTRK